MRNGAYFTAFAAGVLVTTALTLFPEALAATAYAPFAALGGYLLLYGVNLLFVHAGQGEAGQGEAGQGEVGRGAALAPVVAIGLHSFVDGIEYGILFEHDTRTGAIASVGLIAHEFAEGVILYAVLRAAGVGRSSATLTAFVAAALTTPAGALASQPLLAALPEAGMGLLLSGAAGALLYVGATHLPTHLRRGGPRRLRPDLVVTYLLGVALSLSLALGHALAGGQGHAHGATSMSSQGDTSSREPMLACVRNAPRPFGGES